MALLPTENLIRRLQKVCLTCKGTGTVGETKHRDDACKTMDDRDKCLIPVCYGIFQVPCPQCEANLGVFNP